jgi:HK97 gp10 family phage protein
MRFELRGANQLFKNLDLIREEVSEENLRDDAAAALQPVVEDAQALAPVDQGDLRDSIQVAYLEDGAIAVVIADWKGHFFEFGTVKMRAQPMLLPAWDANADEIEGVFAERIRARIEGPGRVNLSRPAIKYDGVFV